MDIQVRHSLAKLAWLEYVSPEFTGPTKRLAEKVIKKTIRSEILPQAGNNDQPLHTAPPTITVEPIKYPTNTPTISYEASTSFDQKTASYRERYR